MGNMTGMNRYLCCFLALVPIIIGIFNSAGLAQCTGRYYDKLFNADETSNVNYGRNVEFDGDTIDLDMHIFEPEGDSFPQRPLIIFAFGGSFTFGDKNSPDIRYLCEEFAQRGYVTATIDYRLGFENGNDSDTNQLKALFRGIQDMRAAIRFFYKDASTTDQWRIDTTQIYIGGVSAGAFIALNLGFIKDSISTSPPPQWAIDAINEVGGTEGESGNPGYSSDVKGVINLCGALADTLWIQPGDPILVSLHGTDDDQVPFFTDTTGQSVEGMLLGSGFIHQRAENIGHTHYLHAFSGAGHVPFILPIPFLPPASQYMDTTVNVIRDFLCDPSLYNSTAPGVVPVRVQLSVFPNPADHKVNIDLSGLNEDACILEVIDLFGRCLRTYHISNKRLVIKKEGLGSGVFFLRLTDTASGKILDIKKFVFI